MRKIWLILITLVAIPASSANAQYDGPVYHDANGTVPTIYPTYGFGYYGSPYYGSDYDYGSDYGSGYGAYAYYPRFRYYGSPYYGPGYGAYAYYPRFRYYHYRRGYRYY